MIALPIRHGVSFKPVFAGWLHIDTVGFPTLYDTFCAQHHFFQHGWILPWTAFHAFSDFAENFLKIVAVTFWNIAHIMVIAAAAGARTTCICLFCNEDINAQGCRCDG